MIKATENNGELYVKFKTWIDPLWCESNKRVQISKTQTVCFVYLVLFEENIVTQVLKVLFVKRFWGFKTFHQNDFSTNKHRNRTNCWWFLMQL